MTTDQVRDFASTPEKGLPDRAPKPHLADGGHWMEDAFKNSHGQLHKSLGVPQDKKIPVGKLESAAHSDSSLRRKRAQLVLNARH